MSNQDYGRFDFVGKVGVFGGVSLLMVVASLIYLAVNGVTYGIDFRGGTEFQVRFAQPVQADQVRDALASLDIGDIGVQAFGDQNEFVIRFQGKTGKNDKETNELLTASIEKVREAVMTQLSSAQPDIRRIDTVGPQVGAELKRNGFLAVFYSLLVILIYIALRFDMKYAPGAVICLFHDTVITLALFVAVGKEVNIPILAAMLTLIGYSLNDTIVVFDRIRETEGHFREKGYKFIINRAINDTLSRTVITSGTTFVSALCLYIFAGGTISDIAFALMVGIALGTYSSVFVAAPMILITDRVNTAKASS